MIHVNFFFLRGEQDTYTSVKKIKNGDYKNVRSGKASNYACTKVYLDFYNAFLLRKQSISCVILCLWHSCYCIGVHAVSTLCSSIEEWLGTEMRMTPRVTNFPWSRETYLFHVWYPILWAELFQYPPGWSQNSETEFTRLHRIYLASDSFRNMGQEMELARRAAFQHSSSIRLFIAALTPIRGHTFPSPCKRPVRLWESSHSGSPKLWFSTKYL